jgi:hypothetical protein
MFDKKQALWIALVAPLAYPLALVAQATPTMYFFLALAMTAAMIAGGNPPQGQESVSVTGHDVLRHGGYASGVLALCMAPDFVVQLLGLSTPLLQRIADAGWLIVPVVAAFYPLYSTFRCVRLLIAEKQSVPARSAARPKARPF